MDHSHLFRTILFPILFVFITFVAEAQFTIPKNVFGSGAVTSGDRNYEMIGTIGQPLIGVNKNSSYNQFTGFWYNKGNFTVGVEHLSNTTPESFQLEQNYPNPFTQMTNVEVQLPRDNQKGVLFKVYDMFGREVLDLSDNIIDNTHVTIVHSQLPSPGIYFYRLITPKFSQTRSMLFIK